MRTFELLNLDQLNNRVKTLVSQHGPTDIVHIDPYSDGTKWSFAFPRVTLRISVIGRALHCEIVDDRLSIPRKVLDSLRVRARRIISAANDGKLPKNSHALAVVVLHALELILDWELETEKELPEDNVIQKWRAGKSFNPELYLTNNLGLDVSSVPDTAFAYLGKTPSQLCDEIPSQFRVVHIESVLRDDLAYRFTLYRDQLSHKLHEVSLAKLQYSMAPHSKLAAHKMVSALRKDDLINDMLTPRVTYHGTPLKNVGSIVRYGFKMPGSLLAGVPVASPRSGIIFDRGIYSSQSPSYALSYASPGMQPTAVGALPTMRVFVCATVMGRTLANRRGEPRGAVHGPLGEGYDSHFDGGFEYIVHHEAAILPCYVIHLDLGAEEAKKAVLEMQKDPFAFESKASGKPHPKLHPHDLMPGDAKRETERRKAAALKWFPNGFGSSKGTSFVIEAIGEIDDDEEEYGDWQQERHGYQRTDPGIYFDEQELYDEFDGGGSKIDAQRQLALDQYQAERRRKK